MISPCVCVGFPRVLRLHPTKNVHVRSPVIGGYKVSECERGWLCVPVMDWRPVQECTPPVSPNDSWDRLQPQLPPPKWMDG